MKNYTKNNASLINVALSLTKEELFELRKSAQENNLTLNRHIEKLLKKDIQFLYFNNGYRYNLNKKKLYCDLEKEVIFPKKEKDLFFQLVCNKNRIVSVDEIKKFVWKEKEKPTIASIRNIVRKIRTKTYSDIIISSPKKGYSVKPIKFLIN